ncbi:hypothetical protein SCLCIDRAFT_1206636 [Scleroderma citrinum Foug A]|uniref:Uncharacterized protein n=1 Tax=Scleroderma citrinum Foug A TaxID=1036808 RepID=A0A0C3ECQ1_9AGAM|nr:hypothetical protein SCLCIDRAFT_1206636 [Scleroderma citrinum Foug A]
MAHYAPSTSSRTVLPPIRTLLDSLEMLEERPVLPSLDKIYGSQELDRETARIHIRNPTTCNRQRRQVPTTLRTPSPTLPCASSSYVRPGAHKASLPQKVRLVPTSIENADAVVVIPPPPTVPHACQAQPLLLVGPALQRFRQPNRQLAKGSRVHPYRIVRGTPEPHAPQRPPMGASNANMKV